MSTKTTDCGDQVYQGITQAKITEMLQDLASIGATVSGTSPSWTITLNHYGVVLQGTWDESNSTLTVTILAKDSYVTCGEVWDKISSIMKGLQ